MQSDPSPSSSSSLAPGSVQAGQSDADEGMTSSNSNSINRPVLNRDQSSTSGRPRGILKNAHPTADGATNSEGVRWDEVNLNLNEVERDATTRMQITEPKTPFVRYDAETDTVEDLDKIPGFELGQRAATDYDDDDGQMDEDTPADGASATGSTSAPGPSSILAVGGQPQPSISSRSSSFSGSRSGSRRGSETSRRGSDVSERKMVVVEDHGPGVDAEDEGADEETRQAKKEFKQRRGSHYSGEGEMMKRFRAGILELDDEDEEGGPGGASQSAVDQEDDEDEQEEEEDEEMQTGAPQGGGTTSGQNGRTRKQGRKIPPVPALPNDSS